MAVYRAVNRAKSQRSAYTLFEIMIVMALILILTAITMPIALQKTHEDVKVTAAADVVRARWADCKAQAVEENRPYVFSIVPNSSKYRVEPYRASSLVGTGLVAGSGLDTTDTGSNTSETTGYLIEDSLPSGVRFGTKEHPVNPDGEEADGSYVRIAVFLPEGGALDDVEIQFAVKGSKTVTLRLRSLTATVSSDIGEVLK
jgi:prepilin-type N-terminal cleavage/methylation domain-containing protein